MKPPLFALVYRASDRSGTATSGTRSQNSESFSSVNSVVRGFRQDDLFVQRGEDQFGQLGGDAGSTGKLFTAGFFDPFDAAKMFK